MVRIEHVALWTNQIEELKNFYVTYFGAQAGEKYFNPAKNFTSYFLTFSEGTRLELMHAPGIAEAPGNTHAPLKGFTHLAISVGSKEAVDELTERLRRGSFKIAGEPRVTGDGYYESVVLDPDGNRIEITI